MEPTEGTKHERVLPPKQEAFCINYVLNDELYSNATLSYAEAYGIDLDSFSKESPVIGETPEGKPIYGESDYKRQYDTCSACASRLLRGAKIQARVRELLNELLRDDYVDAELAKVIRQNYKLESKVAAIREYNKLRQRIVEKMDHTSKGEAITYIIAPEIANKNAINTNTEDSSR